MQHANDACLRPMQWTKIGTAGHPFIDKRWERCWKILVSSNNDPNKDNVNSWLTEALRLLQGQGGVFTTPERVTYLPTSMHTLGPQSMNTPDQQRLRAQGVAVETKTCQAQITFAKILKLCNHYMIPTTACIRKV